MLKMSSWIQNPEKLREFILDEEKVCTEKPKIWTDEVFTCTVLRNGDQHPNCLCELHYSNYERQAIELKFAVLAKSEDVAKAMLTLIRYKIDKWSPSAILSSVCCNLTDEQIQKISVETVFEQLISQMQVMKHDLADTINKTYDRFLLIKFDGMTFLRFPELCNKYKSITVKKEGSGFMVGATIEKSLSEILIFTPTEPCLDQLLNF